MSKFIFGFVMGAVAGSVITCKLIQERYERIAEEEIESVKAIFANRNSYEEQLDDCDYRNDKENTRPYRKKAEPTDYTSYHKSDKKTEEVAKVKPYVIRPEEFGEFDDYETISLTYYSDGVLVNELDEPVEDVETTVGKDSLNTFGRYEDDSVFVRNDILKCDYEILLDTRAYSDVIKTKPHHKED